jgi:hypothetical protein
MLEVITFIPKPDIEIAAVEFTGGPWQGQEVVEWINVRGGTAVWVDVDHGDWKRCGMREHIKIILGSAYMFVYVGDYVMQEPEGVIKPLSQRLIAAKYDRAFVPKVISILPVVTKFEEELQAA